MGYVHAMPQIYDYLDYRAFLRDWYDAAKKSASGTSFRKLSKAAGFSSSSALSHIMSGDRNLSSESTEAVAVAFGLDEPGTEFFRALVALDQGRTEEERNEAWAYLSATKRFRSARRLQGDSVRFLSTWFMPAVHQLAACEDFRPDPEWIASAMRPGITVEQAQEALEVLTSIGLLRPREDGSLEPVDATLVVPPEVEQLAVCNYYRQMSERGGASVAGFQPEERHLLGVTVAIPPDLLPAVKTELDRMQARLLDLCDGAAEPAQTVYQINLQFFPLADSRSST